MNQLSLKLIMLAVGKIPDNIDVVKRVLSDLYFIQNVMQLKEQ